MYQTAMKLSIGRQQVLTHQRTGSNKCHSYSRVSRLTCKASAEAGKMIVDGKNKYEAGDRMGALRLWENAMDKSPTPEQQQAALFNQTCVHAGFGDVETAQMTLRDALLAGLDFKQAIEAPTSFDPQLVRLQASQQVLIRLRKFSEATLKAAKAASAPPTSSSYSATGNSSRRKATLMDNDLSEMLETDMQGIDTSIGGIVRRVAVLLLLLSIMGTGLFYLGLKYAFTEGPY